MTPTRGRRVSTWLDQLRAWRSHRLAPASVLMTGAAGEIGRLLRPTLRATYSGVRLTDRDPIDACTDGEQFAWVDLARTEAVNRVVEGVQSIVHLGAMSKDGSIEALAPANVYGVTHLLDSAVKHGVKRVVLASSMHVVGLYRREHPVSCMSAPRPDSLYGLTKCYAELLARLYHERHGLSVVILRLGHVTHHREDAEPGNWLNADDLVRLVLLAIQADPIGCEVWHALTDGEADDPTHEELARRFGFEFSLRSTHVSDQTEALRRWYPDDEVARTFRGGIFASGRAVRKADP